MIIITTLQSRILASGKQFQFFILGYRGIGLVYWVAGHISTKSYFQRKKTSNPLNCFTRAPYRQRTIDVWGRGVKFLSQSQIQTETNTGWNKRTILQLPDFPIAIQLSDKHLGCAPIIRGPACSKTKTNPSLGSERCQRVIDAIHRCHCQCVPKINFF